MMQASLRCRVGKGLERRHMQAIDGSDVYHAAGGCRAGGGFEEGRHGLCELEDALEVERQNAVPGS